MPVSAPFQPACAAPITRALGSTSRIGPQSAAVAPIARPSVRVTMASARGRDAALPRAGGDHDIGRMDLMHGEKMLRRNAHLLRHPAAVFRDMGGIVVASRCRH